MAWAEYNSSLTPEERKDKASRAGKATGEPRRLKRTQADILRQILVLDYTDPERRKLLMQLGLSGNFADAINLSVLEKAAKGDVEAARYMRDTIGEKPRDGLEIGNLDGQPLSTIDLSSMTDDQLRALIAARETQSEV